MSTMPLFKCVTVLWVVVAYMIVLFFGLVHSDSEPVLTPHAMYGQVQMFDSRQECVDDYGVKKWFAETQCFKSQFPACVDWDENEYVPPRVYFIWVVGGHWIRVKKYGMACKHCFHEGYKDVYMTPVGHTVIAAYLPTFTVIEPVDNVYDFHISRFYYSQIQCLPHRCGRKSKSWPRATVESKEGRSLIAISDKARQYLDFVTKAEFLGDLDLTRKIKANPGPYQYECEECSQALQYPSHKNLKNANPNQVSCELCGSGTYPYFVTSAGVREWMCKEPTDNCRIVEHGRFASCQQCDSGHAVNQEYGSAHYFKRCDECHAGKYEQTGADANRHSKCEQCPDGKFRSQSKQTHCDPCNDGYVVNPVCREDKEEYRAARESLSLGQQGRVCL